MAGLGFNNVGFVGSLRGAAPAAPAGSAYDADAQAFFTATALASAGEKTLINDFTIGLKNNNLWTGALGLYLFVGGTAASHRFNLRNAADTDAAGRLVFPAGATHLPDRIRWNGTSQYARTFLSVTGQSSTLGYFALSASTTANDVAIGTSVGNSETYLQQKNGSGSSVYAAAGQYLTVPPTAVGFQVGTSDGTTMRLFKEGTLLGEQPVTGAPVTAADIYINGFHSVVGAAPSNLTDADCGFACVLGYGMSVAQYATFNNLVQTLMTGLGR